MNPPSDVSSLNSGPFVRSGELVPDRGVLQVVDLAINAPGFQLIFSLLGDIGELSNSAGICGGDGRRSYGASGCGPSQTAV